MTRRTFLQKLFVAGSGVLASVLVFAKKISPRKFLRARPISKYPGRMKDMENITSQAKWSG